VWRLKINLGDRTDVLNIAQDSHRLVRIMETRGVKIAPDGRLRTHIDFSRYGDSATVRLPQACR
jgi:hypothetical protein